MSDTGHGWRLERLSCPLPVATAGWSVRDVAPPQPRLGSSAHLGLSSIAQVLRESTQAGRSKNSVLNAHLGAQTHHLESVRPRMHAVRLPTYMFTDRLHDRRLAAARTGTSFAASSCQSVPINNLRSGSPSLRWVSNAHGATLEQLSCSSTLLQAKGRQERLREPSTNASTLRVIGGSLGDALTVEQERRRDAKTYASTYASHVQSPARAFQGQPRKVVEVVHSSRWHQRQGAESRL